MKVLRVLMWGGILLIASPLSGQYWWTETTRADFADGQFDVGLYAAGIGIANSGAVQMINIRDIDKDGEMDFVISNNRTGDTLTIRPQAYYAYHFDDLAIVDTLFSLNGSGNLIVDYDNDGALDIVLSAYNDSLGEMNRYSRIYYGPNWTSMDSFFTRGACAISSADLDNDGDLDLVVSNLAGYALVRYQTDGAPTTDSLPCQANVGNAIADLDRDGYPDIVLAGMQGRLFYGPGFDEVLTFSGADSLTDVSIADLNNDDTLDVIFSAMGIWSYIFYGPLFTVKDSISTQNARGVSVANLDATSPLDIVFSNWRENTTGRFAVPSCIILGPDYANEPPILLSTHGAIGNMIADYDGDGNLDICFTNWTDSTGNHETYSYIYPGPEFAAYDSVSTRGAHMSTTSDLGNVYTREPLEVYVSSVYDAGRQAQWDSVLYTVDMPPSGSNFDLFVQTGDSPNPDTTWSDWLSVANADTLPDSLASRYIRYKAEFTNDFLDAPRLEEVKIGYPGVADATPDSIISPVPGEVENFGTYILLVQVANLGEDPATFPVHCMLDSAGVTIFDSTRTVEDLAGGTETPVYFGTVYCAPGETLWVITELPSDQAPENDTLTAVLGQIAVGEQPVLTPLTLEASVNGKEVAVSYGLPCEEMLTISLYDAAGRLVRILDEGRRQAGNHHLVWDGRDEKGSNTPPGVYFIRLQARDKTLNVKILIVE